MITRAIRRAFEAEQRLQPQRYPPDAEVINVANMRHLWLLPATPNFGWKRGATLSADSQDKTDG